MIEPEFPDLSERAQSVLVGLVRRYIQDGSPVGSRTLAKQTELSLSPASIRNVMSDLEDYGLIHAPHTSAGRIPTAQGYRFFINGLLKAGPINRQSMESMSGRFEGVADPNSILAGATEMLSQITSFAGIVSTPDHGKSHIRQIEFLKLTEQRVLAILVTEDGQVQNKVLSAHRDYSDSELVEAANYFNAEYSSKSLDGVRSQLFAHMKLDHKSMHREMRTAIKMAGQLFDDEEHSADNVLVSGENNLLSIPEFTELNKLKQLFDTFKTKQVLFDLLQKSMNTEGVNIFIGEESGYEPFRDCSIIAAPYEVDHQKVGVLGVIGPTRMQYEEVISAVDVTARLVGSALSAQGSQ
jgi:heat-inducible transcriptional repressor